MPKPRGYQKGQLIEVGKGTHKHWACRAYVDVLEDGQIRRVKRRLKIGPCSTLSKEQASKRMTEMLAEISEHESTGTVGMEHGTLHGLLESKVQIKGHVGELLVSADLLRNGYEVFTHICHHSSCDLVAISADGSTLKVEVKYIGSPKTGSALSWKFRNSQVKFDLLAAIYQNGRIEYFDSKGKSCNIRARTYPTGINLDSQPIENEEDNTEWPEPCQGRSTVENRAFNL